MNPKKSLKSRLGADEAQEALANPEEVAVLIHPEPCLKVKAQAADVPLASEAEERVRARQEGRCFLCGHELGRQVRPVRYLEGRREE